MFCKQLVALVSVILINVRITNVPTVTLHENINHDLLYVMTEES